MSTTTNTSSSAGQKKKAVKKQIAAEIAALPARMEADSIGEMLIPPGTLWGVQTQRSLLNFPIGQTRMPFPIIKAMAIIKKCCAQYNLATNATAFSAATSNAEEESAKIGAAIIQAADEIIDGTLSYTSHFPLVVYQTGSGTQTNMNCNEVIANRACLILGDGHPETLGGCDEGAKKVRKPVHPNDHVNKGQSSNDSFPTAMHIACVQTLVETTLPGLARLKRSLAAKVVEFDAIVKIGRTHCQDATPISLGQEFSGYEQQIAYAMERLERTMAASLYRLALGGTAVGTGLNTVVGYDQAIAHAIATETGLPFTTAPNKFEALAGHDSIVESCVV